MPAGTFEGWALFSTNAAGPVGVGPWGGLHADPITLYLVTLFPLANPGDPVHWTWPVSSPLYPADNLNLPPGTFPALLYGTSWDFVGVAVSCGFTLSTVTRVRW